MNKDIKSLYIHIPFCNSICNYCDFPKLQYFRFLAIDYIKALKKEITSFNINHQLETIYIGGGTPTAIEDDLFEELLSFIFSFTKDIKEFTVEANPESLTISKLEIMKRYGVNRISIGVESTNDQILKYINRLHTFEDVKTCIKNAREIGFNNINVDLILGLPNVLKTHLSKDLENILALNVEHISCYSLTVHPNTIFGINNVPEGNDETERELYDLVEETLTKNGFIHYEISNWAKPGFESRHNFAYWKDEQYYGAGLGAAGYIGNIRYYNTKSINKYNEGQFLAEQEVVFLDDDFEYYLMLNLRTNRGIKLAEFEEKFGFNLYESKKEIIDNFIKDGYLLYEESSGSIIPTYSGMMILDTVVLGLLNDE